MRGHSDRVVPSVERDELRFEHDVSVDLQRGVCGLDAAETGCGGEGLLVCVPREGDGKEKGKERKTY